MNLPEGIPRKDVTVAGIVAHTHIGSYAVAETVLERLAQVSATETTVAILQRLNNAKPGRCPCCGFKAQWGEERLKPNWERLSEIMGEAPNESE